MQSVSHKRISIGYYLILLLLLFTIPFFGQLRLICQGQEHLETGRLSLTVAIQSEAKTHTHRIHVHEHPKEQAQDESCCSLTGVSDLYPSLVVFSLKVPQIKYFLNFVSEMLRNSTTIEAPRQLRLAQLNAPPPISLSHIPTTILMI